MSFRFRPTHRSKRSKAAAPGGVLITHSGSNARLIGQPEFLWTKKDRTTAKQQRLEFQAAKRVVPWTRLSPNDYDFRSWATQGSKGLLRAGCVYEYARESRKLRCLLVLINSAFQKAKQAEKTRSRAPFRGLQFLWLSFEGLRYKDALIRLGGWFGWLRSFTDQLADNKSFTGLRKTNQKRLNEALEILPRYFLAPKAISLALPSDLIEPRVLWPSQMPGDAHQREAENELRIRLEIRLRDFTDKEIAAAMKELAGSLRTQKQPQRKGTGKKVSTRSRLDALSAMRLASHFPKTAPPTRGELSAWLSGDSPELKKSAIELFNTIRLGGRKDIAESNFDALINEARELFLKTFPFSETTENSSSFKDRGI